MAEVKDSLKSFEGAVSNSFSEKVTAEQIRLFCQAVGAEPSDEAPPTFLTFFRAGEFALFDKMGLKLSNVLHAEQQYRYVSPIRAGEEISFQTKTSSVLEKKGSTGRLSFLTFQTDFETKGSNSRPVGSSITTVIFREKVK